MAYTNLTYDDRLNNALLKKLWLQRDIADFTAFNPIKFTPQFITDCDTAYQTALQIPTDETLSDVGSQKTELVTKKMEAARNLYQRKVKYFLEEAFNKQLGILNSFGYNDYQNIRTNVSGMISFLTNLEIRCTQEQTTLSAVGMSATITIDIKTAKDELVMAYTDQQTFFGMQKNITQDRKIAFEQMDTYVKDICRAGKMIYEGINNAKYSDYLIYQSSSNQNTTTQTITANTEEPILSTGIIENVGIQLENIGNADLVVYINDSLAPTATGFDLSIGATQVTTTNSLSVGEYGKLIVRNVNAIDGKIKVKVLNVIE